MGYLNQVFNWQWNYYTVTNKGVTFLAKALGKYLRHAISNILVSLGVSGNVVPSTYKMKKTAVAAPPKAEDGEGEKPAAVATEANAEEATPTPMGRGTR